MELIKDVLERVINSLELSAPLLAQKAVEIWDEIVGIRIKRNTFPEKVKNGILYVYVINSIWAQELHLMKMDILDAINKKLGKELIKDIIFRVGEIPAPKPEIKRKRDPEFFSWMKEEAERIASHVDDPLLRDSIIRAYISYLKKKISGSRDNAGRQDR